MFGLVKRSEFEELQNKYEELRKQLMECGADNLMPDKASGWSITTMRGTHTYYSNHYKLKDVVQMILDHLKLQPKTIAGTPEQKVLAKVTTNKK